MGHRFMILSEQHVEVVRRLGGMALDLFGGEDTCGIAMGLPTPRVLRLYVWTIFHGEWDNSLTSFVPSSPCRFEKDVGVSLHKTMDSEQVASLFPILPQRKHNTGTFSYTISCQNVPILRRIGSGLIESS